MVYTRVHKWKWKGLRRALIAGVFLSFAIVLAIAAVRGMNIPSAIAATPPTITHGPVTGNVTDGSATVFIRLSRKASVALRYSAQAEGLSSGNFQTSSIQIADRSGNFTVRIPLTNLQPSTTYYFAVMANNILQPMNSTPHFQTFPSPGSTVDFKIVNLTDFCCFSRTGYNPPLTNTFQSAYNEQPNLVLIGGDFDHRNPTGINIASARREKRAMFQDLYTSYSGTSVLVNKILREFPVAHMWDDHDYGDNNGDKNYQFKKVSLAVLNEYFPTYPTSKYGDWQKFRYGQAEFFLLDSRSQRDFHLDTDGSNKSMLDGDNLGSAGQYVWLTEGLKNSTARWKFVVSPVVFNPTLAKLDSWAGYLNEQQKLLDFIRTNGIKNIIVISGDLHAGGIDDGTNARLPEILVPSASLVAVTKGDVACASIEAEGIGIWSAGTYFDQTSGTTCQGYGVIKVLTNPDRVILEVKNQDGVVKITQTIAVQ